MPSTRDREAGFTLIELLVSVAILGVLMAAVTAAMIVGLRTNASTGARLDESRDEQFIAAYFSADAQGAQTIRVGGGPVVPTCRFPAGDGTVVVEFVGEDFTDAAAPTVTARTVSYLRRPAAGGGAAELHRLVCTDGASTPAPGGDTTLARNLSATPKATCVSSGPPAAPCNGVRLTVTSGSLEYTLTAYKRTT